MKQAWHTPIFRLLDARATAQADLDAAHQDPNDLGDVPSWEDNGTGSETRTGFGRQHERFDS